MLLARDSIHFFKGLRYLLGASNATLLRRRNSRQGMAFRTELSQRDFVRGEGGMVPLSYMLDVRLLVMGTGGGWGRCCPARLPDCEMRPMLMTKFTVAHAVRYLQPRSINLHFDFCQGSRLWE